jgi:putative intracellular protease/amidase
VVGQENKKSSTKILMVVSSYGKDAGKSRPGFEMDEFTQAYYIFKDNNIDVEVASPKGGKVESDKYNSNKLYNKRFLEDPTAQSLLDNTSTTASLVNESYDAVYVVGGKGVMFDLPVDPSLQEIISEIYKNDGIVSAVCHGPAAFVNVKLDNEFMVKNQIITGYCNSEEEKFGKVWINELPYLLENKLID